MLKTLLQRIRRNHALEHATINLLSAQHPEAHLIGLSGPWGFVLYTSLTTDEVVPAVMEALKRLKRGERHLGIHERCGTNLIVTATLTMLATLIGYRRPKEDEGLLQRLELIPYMILLNVVALLVSQPLRLWVQANLTTDADLSDTEVSAILTTPAQPDEMHRIRVRTRPSQPSTPATE